MELPFEKSWIRYWGEGVEGKGREGKQQRSENDNLLHKMDTGEGCKN